MFPFWLLWILLKGAFILLSLPFGGWRRFFKSAKSEEEDPGVVEKKLKNLSSEQQTIQTRMNKRAALWKSVSRYILMYSAIAEVWPKANPSGSPDGGKIFRDELQQSFLLVLVLP